MPRWPVPGPELMRAKPIKDEIFLLSAVWGFPDEIFLLSAVWGFPGGASAVWGVQ